MHNKTVHVWLATGVSVYMGSKLSSFSSSDSSVSAPNVGSCWGGGGGGELLL